MQVVVVGVDGDGEGVSDWRVQVADLTPQWSGTLSCRFDLPYGESFAAP